MYFPVGFMRRAFMARRLVSPVGYSPPNPKSDKLFENLSSTACPFRPRRREFVFAVMLFAVFPWFVVRPLRGRMETKKRVPESMPASEALGDLFWIHGENAPGGRVLLRSRTRSA